MPPSGRLDRRRFLRALAGAAGVLGAAVVLSGCPGGGDEDGDGGDGDED